MNINEQRLELAAQIATQAIRATAFFKISKELKKLAPRDAALIVKALAIMFEEA